MAGTETNRIFYLLEGTIHGNEMEGGQWVKGRAEESKNFAKRYEERKNCLCITWRRVKGIVLK